MNDPAGIVSHAGTLLPPMAATSRVSIQPTWEPSKSQLSKKDTITASAFLLFYLAAYLAAGYAGVTLIEWAWMRIFG
jgi:hypothetical protein